MPRKSHTKNGRVGHKTSRRSPNRGPRSKNSGGHIFSRLFFILLLVCFIGGVWSFATGNPLPFIGDSISQYSPQYRHNQSVEAQMHHSDKADSLDSDENIGPDGELLTDETSGGDIGILGSAKKSIKKLVKAVNGDVSSNNRNVIKKDNEKARTPAPSDKTKMNQARTDSSKAKIALVIDDFGYRQDVIDAYNALDIPLTYAVLPYKMYSAEAATSGHAAGKAIILHLPMQSNAGANAEDITIETAMTEGQINEIINNALAAVPHVSGVNNHQGSKATGNSRIMSFVMKALKNKGLFFIDSRTNPSSVAYQMAREYRVPAAVNELFIDNSSDEEDIKDKLRQVTQMALNSPSGYAIAIGHARPHTVAAIRDMIGPMQEAGIEFIFVRQVVH